MIGCLSLSFASFCFSIEDFWNMLIILEELIFSSIASFDKTILYKPSRDSIDAPSLKYESSASYTSSGKSIDCRSDSIVLKYESITLDLLVNI